jgi:hypothetical protein
VKADSGIETEAGGVAMSRWFILTLLILALGAGSAWTQISSSQSVQPVQTSASGPVSTASTHDGLPPLPQGEVTLIGGTIRELDQVRDRMVLQAFGGGDVTVLFDARTGIYRHGSRVAPGTLRRGDRVYVDTVLDGKNIFARAIRLQNQVTGESSGQVQGYDRRGGELIVRDALAGESVRVGLDPSTVIAGNDGRISAQELIPGTLVTIQFRADGTGRAIANQIKVLAKPGSEFIFAGRLVHVDDSRRLMVVTDPRDNQSYEVTFDPGKLLGQSDLHEGAEVTVSARFDGKTYVATGVTVNPASGR